jgi:diguanylate cyclase (GGDEF)-like protein
VFRLTVGRRIALVVALAIGAISLILLLVLRAGSNRSVDRAATDLGALSASLTEGIENELERAGQRLEFAARSTGDLELTAAIERLTSTGFVAVELMDPDDLVADVEVTNNFLQRAAESTAIGATRVLDGRVGVVVGSPIQSGERRGEVLVGVYDAGDMLATVGAARVGDTGEALLSVRNAEDDLVIFSPSRHNSNSPVGRIDADTTESIEAAFESAEPLVLSSANINGRDSVSVLREIESPRWVLLTSIDRDEVRVDAVPWWLLPMVAVVGGLALIPVVLLRRRLREVVRAAQQLSRGRLTTEIVDPTEDEIGLLARTLQSLDDRLQSDTEQRGRSAAMLQHRATHDPLTGLANRARLVEELTIALNNRDSLAVLFCDIDDFKGINDSQGHEGGDIVLKFVANQLASVCGSSELISRFGGDEFCVLSRSEPHEARVLASSVERALDATCIVNGNQQKVGGSVGLAVAKVTDTPDSLLKSADLAMYREKERRRGLRRAQRREDDEPQISPEQIRLAFQPVVELVENSIVGVEVLARYMHPEMGMLDPSSFLPPGTERGMFDKFDLEIMTRSLEQLSEWLTDGVIDERFTMSLNLSPDHVSDSDSTRQIFDIIRQHRVPASMVQIEVTEHMLSAHADDLLNSLNRLRESGLKVAIDDFGVEGSNVDRLIQIPSDVVKIDRSYVMDIDIDERAEARLKAILDIVETEGLRAIAEGVERQGQARVLRKLGVPFGQGYLWHAPISALALTPLLGRASRWSRKKPAPQKD